MRTSPGPPELGSPRILRGESLPLPGQLGLVYAAVSEYVPSEAVVMLAEYIDKAMEQAVYEIIEDEGTYWGEIPGLQGVWARHTTLEGCRHELREALSDWIALRLRLGLSIPVVAGIDLNELTQPV